MKTLQEFIAEAAQQHGSVNLLFEQGMYSLTDDLERIVTVLRDAKILFEVIGGVAVNAHILGVHQKPVIRNEGHRPAGSASRLAESCYIGRVRWLYRTEDHGRLHANTPRTAAGRSGTSAIRWRKGKIVPSSS